MWDWCGYFGEAGDFCVRVEREQSAYVMETSDGRGYRLEEGKLRCVSPYGVCVELKRDRVEVYLLSTQEKLGEVKLR